VPLRLKSANGSIEVENLPSAQDYIQHTEAGHGSPGISACHQSDERWPMKPVGGHYEEVVFAPGPMPREIYKEDSYLKADQNEEQNC